MTTIIPTTSKKIPLDKQLCLFFYVDLFSTTNKHSCMSCRIAFSSSNRTTNNSAIAIDTTSATDMIYFASVNRPFYENDSFILDRNCETRTLKETLKRR
jgi:hypothetical protein